MFVCNICKESFEGDRSTCLECFEEIAAIVSSNLFPVQEFPVDPNRVKRKYKMHTTFESCKSKTPYKTPEDAIRHRKKLAKKLPGVKKQRIYKCDSCAFWHLTSMKK